MNGWNYSLLYQHKASVACGDCTYIGVTKSSDSHYRMDTYSGALGKGQVLKVDTLCTPDGRPVAVKPGGNVN